MIDPRRRSALIRESEMAIKFDDAALRAGTERIGLTTLYFGNLTANQLYLAPRKLRAAGKPALQEVRRYLPAPDANDDMRTIGHHCPQRPPHIPDERPIIVRRSMPVI